MLQYFKNTYEETSQRKTNAITGTQNVQKL